MAKLAQAVDPNMELFPILSRFPPVATDFPLTGIARLAAGDMARLERERGSYLYIRTGAMAGWIDRTQFGLISRTE